MPVLLLFLVGAAAGTLGYFVGAEGEAHAAPGTGPEPEHGYSTLYEDDPGVWSVVAVMFNDPFSFSGGDWAAMIQYLRSAGYWTEADMMLDYYETATLSIGGCYPGRDERICDPSMSPGGYRGPVPLPSTQPMSEGSGYPMGNGMGNGMVPMGEGSPMPYGPAPSGPAPSGAGMVPMQLPNGMPVLVDPYGNVYPMPMGYGPAPINTTGAAASPAQTVCPNPVTICPEGLGCTYPQPTG